MRLSGRRARPITPSPPRSRGSRDFDDFGEVVEPFFAEVFFAGALEREAGREPCDREAEPDFEPELLPPERG